MPSYSRQRQPRAAMPLTERLLTPPQLVDHGLLVLVGGHLEVVVLERQVADDLGRPVLQGVSGEDVLQAGGAADRVSSRMREARRAGSTTTWSVSTEVSTSSVSTGSRDRKSVV